MTVVSSGVHLVGEVLCIDLPTCVGKDMQAVQVKICRYADDSQPGWVECELVDALGQEHTFVEKVPVVTKGHLDASSSFPQAGFIACIVLGKSKHDDGRQLACIDTQTPWGIESTAGRSRFDVFSEQLCELRCEGEVR